MSQIWLFSRPDGFAIAMDANANGVTNKNGPDRGRTINARLAKTDQKKEETDQ